MVDTMIVREGFSSIGIKGANCLPVILQPDSLESMGDVQILG